MNSPALEPVKAEERARERAWVPKFQRFDSRLQKRTERTLLRGTSGSFRSGGYTAATSTWNKHRDYDATSIVRAAGCTGLTRTGRGEETDERSRAQRRVFTSDR